MENQQIRTDFIGYLHKLGYKPYEISNRIKGKPYYIQSDPKDEDFYSSYGPATRTYIPIEIDELSCDLMRDISIRFVWGLNEVKHPPTLINPRPHYLVQWGDNIDFTKDYSLVLHENERIPSNFSRHNIYKDCDMDKVFLFKSHEQIFQSCIASLKLWNQDTYQK